MKKKLLVAMACTAFLSGCKDTTNSKSLNSEDVSVAPVLFWKLQNYICDDGKKIPLENIGMEIIYSFNRNNTGYIQVAKNVANPNAPYNTNPNAPYNTNPNAPYNTNPNAPYNANLNAPYNANLNAPYNANLNAPYNANLNAPYNTNPNLNQANSGYDYRSNQSSVKRAILDSTYKNDASQIEVIPLKLKECRNAKDEIVPCAPEYNLQDEHTFYGFKGKKTVNGNKVTVELVEEVNHKLFKCEKGAKVTQLEFSK